jgi:hypothetical protein
VESSISSILHRKKQSFYLEKTPTKTEEISSLSGFESVRESSITKRLIFRGRTRKFIG